MNQNEGRMRRRKPPKISEEEWNSILLGGEWGEDTERIGLLVKIGRWLNIILELKDALTKEVNQRQEWVMDIIRKDLREAYQEFIKYLRIFYFKKKAGISKLPQEYQIRFHHLIDESVKVLQEKGQGDLTQKLIQALLNDSATIRGEQPLPRRFRKRPMRKPPSGQGDLFQ